MRHSVLRLAFALSLSAFCAAPEAARGVVTAAAVVGVVSFTRPETPNSKLAQDVVPTLLGTGMGLDAGGGSSSPRTLNPVTTGAPVPFFGPELSAAAGFIVHGTPIEAPGIGYGVHRYVDCLVKSVGDFERMV